MSCAGPNRSWAQNDVGRSDRNASRLRGENVQWDLSTMNGMIVIEIFTGLFRSVIDQEIVVFVIELRVLVFSEKWKEFRRLLRTGDRAYVNELELEPEKNTQTAHLKGRYAHRSQKNE